jgi:hypothetical protein
MYRCWDPETGEEDDAKEIDAFSPDSAARLWAERRHADDDYPEYRTVFVRAPEGCLHAFEIHATPSVEFHARALEMSRPRSDKP